MIHRPLCQRRAGNLSPFHSLRVGETDVELLRTSVVHDGRMLRYRALKRDPDPRAGARSRQVVLNLPQRHLFEQPLVSRDWRIRTMRFEELWRQTDDKRGVALPAFGSGRRHARGTCELGWTLFHAALERQNLAMIEALANDFKSATGASRTCWPVQFRG